MITITDTLNIAGKPVMILVHSLSPSLSLAGSPFRADGKKTGYPTKTI